MKMGARKLKLPKPEVPKKTTTIRFGWKHNNDLWSLRENSLDESERGGDKTLEVQIPKVNIDCPMEKDVQRFIYNFEASA